MHQSDKDSSGQQRLKNDIADSDAYLNIDALDPAKSYPCPKCLLPTDSLKCFYFTDWMVFAIVRVFVWESIHFACPRCMRKILWRRLALNILPANVIWPVLVLIYLPRYLNTYQRGHSRQLTEKPKPPPKFFMHIGAFFECVSQHLVIYIFLIVLAICSGFMAFTGRHDFFDDSRIWFALILILLILRILADVRKAIWGDVDADMK